jgi:hypothetical protein
MILAARKEETDQPKVVILRFMKCVATNVKKSAMALVISQKRV